MRNFVLTLAFIASLFAVAPLIAAPININQATAQEIADNLNGVGIKKAQAIVQYRDKIG